MSRNAFDQIERDTNEAEGLREHAKMERQTSHTKEPWMAGTMPITELAGRQVEYHCVGIEGTTKAVAVTGSVGNERDAESAADARRIAACVNACREVSTEWLEENKSIVVLPAPMADRFRAQNQALEENKRMFVAACSDLGAINKRLGLDSDDGGAEPILEMLDVLDQERNELLAASRLILSSFSYAPEKGPAWYEAARLVVSKADAGIEYAKLDAVTDSEGG